MDDHPNWGLPLAKHNNNANRDDLLFEAERDQDFVSAFVAISPQNRATTLAYVCWRASWKIRCKFVGITCQPTLVDKTFKVDQWQLGQPADTEQAALLTDLSGDYAHTANGWDSRRDAGARPFRHRHELPQFPADRRADGFLASQA